MKPPAYYEALAFAAQNEKDWTAAAQWWEKAKGASLGHTRRARYEARRDLCTEKAGLNNKLNIQD